MLGVELPLEKVDFPSAGLLSGEVIPAQALIASLEVVNHGLESFQRCGLDLMRPGGF